VKLKYNGGDVDVYIDTDPEWSAAQSWPEDSSISIPISDQAILIREDE